ITQVWPDFGEAPVPGWVSMIFSPEGVVMTGWALAGVRMAGTIAAIAATAASVSRRVRTRILFSLSVDRGTRDCLPCPRAHCKGFACPAAVVDSGLDPAIHADDPQ